MQEKRRYTRYHPSLNVNYIYVRGLVLIEDSTYIKDISKDGMRLYLSSVIKKGDIFLVEINLPFIGRISAIAKAVWTKKINGSSEAGVIFDWISNAEKLARYIQELQLKAA